MMLREGNSITEIFHGIWIRQRLYHNAAIWLWIDSESIRSGNACTVNSPRPATPSTGDSTSWLDLGCNWVMWFCELPSHACINWERERISNCWNSDEGSTQCCYICSLCTLPWAQWLSGKSICLKVLGLNHRVFFCGLNFSLPLSCMASLTPCYWGVRMYQPIEGVVFKCFLVGSWHT